MHYSTLSGAAVLLALAPSALAVGSATLVNACGFDIYYVADAGTYGGMTALSPGATYSAPYGDAGQGVSIKIAPSNDLGGPITQFETTWADGKIYYDISNINGSPFTQNGMSLSPSIQNDPNNPTCVDVDCPAVLSGDSTCAAAYNQPDDTATKVCADSTSLTMVVCTSGGSDSATSSSNTTGWSKREAAPTMLHSHHRIHTRHFPK